ncbi:hypothetical protein C1646_776428 [Rhizophagus diaphanus]|nr:hypothetical protein C1646_776428 [Rhizophagus diaphanus] [Rhizophagus sp. MUCL 43196]
MSFFPRADDYVPSSLNYTPPGPNDFHFNHSNTPSSPSIEDTSPETPLDNKIPKDNKSATFKEFHAKHLYNRWAKGRVKNNFSTRLGISFMVKYHTYKVNSVIKKGYNFIYSKIYSNFKHTPSSTSKIKKRQAARFEALQKHIFSSSHLEADASIDDKFLAAHHHTLLFYENQQIYKPIKHLYQINKNRVTSPDDVPSNSEQSSAIPVDNSFKNVPAHLIPLIPNYPIYEEGYLDQSSIHQQLKQEQQKEIDAVSTKPTSQSKSIRNKDKDILKELRSQVEVLELSLTIMFDKVNIAQIYGTNSIMEHRPLK